jgi:transcription-repair coupling factor (superfamily II helicase)
MLLFYADDAKLYVPVERLDLVSVIPSLKDINHNSIVLVVLVG